MEVVDCDTANARLAIRLEVEDLTATCQETSDSEEQQQLLDRIAALRLQLEELANVDNVQAGRRIQQSLYRAMLSDFPEVDALLNEEAAVSTASAQGEPSEPNAKRIKRTLREDGRDGYYEDPHVDPRGHTTLSDYVKNLKEEESKPRTECYICMGVVLSGDTIEIGQCSHPWCRQCVVAAFQLALKDEGSYPVRCCKEVPTVALDHSGVVGFVGDVTITALKVKAIEYGTVDRTYCHDPKCSAFIVPTPFASRAALCPTCRKLTCALCAFAEQNSATNVAGPGRPASAHDGRRPVSLSELQSLPSAKANPQTFNRSPQRCTTKNPAVTIIGQDNASQNDQLKRVQTVAGIALGGSGNAMTATEWYAKDAEETTDQYYWVARRRKN